MAAILTSLRNTILAGFGLAFIVFLIYLQEGGIDHAFGAFVFPLVACDFGRYVDRIALVFQLCANPNHAENP